jgi:hypothetical protein
MGTGQVRPPGRRQASLDATQLDATQLDATQADAATRVWMLNLAEDAQADITGRWAASGAGVSPLSGKMQVIEAHRTRIRWFQPLVTSGPSSPLNTRALVLGMRLSEASTEAVEALLASASCRRRASSVRGVLS